jgi:ribosome hibernation promoting factor
MTQLDLDSERAQRREKEMRTRRGYPSVQLTVRRSNFTETLKEYVRNKIAALHLDYPKIVEVQVVLDIEQWRNTAEVILYCTNYITIKGSSENDDMYASINQAIDRVAHQMRKCNSRLMRKS